MSNTSKMILAGTVSTVLGFLIVRALERREAAEPKGHRDFQRVRRALMVISGRHRLNKTEPLGVRA